MDFSILDNPNFYFKEQLISFTYESSVTSADISREIKTVNSLSNFLRHMNEVKIPQFHS
jgi:hypothetical protein